MRCIGRVFASFCTRRGKTLVFPVSLVYYISVMDYKKLYQLFEGVTPLKTDCGALCEKACCKGEDTVGMLLFPGEETSLPAVEAGGRRFVLCGGTCQRENRPLSCRIFPFFPAADAKGRITAVIDPRGLSVCPLVRQAEHVRFDPRFARRVKTAGKLLAKDPACLAFLREVTEEIREAAQMRDLLDQL